jgi:hypothetical protein
MSFETTHVRSQGPSTVGLGGGGGRTDMQCQLSISVTIPLLSFGTRSLDSFASASTPKIKRVPRL